MPKIITRDFEEPLMKAIQVEFSAKDVTKLVCDGMIEIIYIIPIEDISNLKGENIWGEYYLTPFHLPRQRYPTNMAIGDFWSHSA